MGTEGKKKTKLDSCVFYDTFNLILGNSFKSPLKGRTGPGVSITISSSWRTAWMDTKGGHKRI